MPSIQQNATAVRRCVELYNQRTLEYIDVYFGGQAEWTEFLPPVAPGGHQGNREFMRAASQQRLLLFPDRQMSIQGLVAQGDQVAVELDWSGTPAMTMGAFQAGISVHMRIASFFTLLDGLIVKQTDYCVSIQDIAAHP